MRTRLAASLRLSAGLLATTIAVPTDAQVPRFRPGSEESKGPVLADALPVDERLTTGVLDNGLTYVIRRHTNPPGKVGIWIHIGSGSLNETDEQRGLAHYLEHMAFNGSENFPPGEVVKYFESIGLTFGRDQNAFTSFDQTAYQLYLPDTERGTLARGLTFFKDVASGLLLRPEDIDEERGVIFEELRTGKGPAQRIRDQWLARLAPGSLIGERLPIGTEETLAAIDRDDFLAYYNKWYVPSNMTVLVVGDIDPAVAEEEIRAVFADLPAVPDPENNDAMVRPYTERRAIVAHDPEITRAEVAIMLIDEPTGPTMTIGDLRGALTRRLALEAFNRRLAAKVDAGEARMLGGGAFAQDLFGVMRLAQASAAARPDAWQPALEDLVTEVRRAELHGFSEAEIDVARASVLAGLEQDAQQEPTLPERVILGRLASTVSAEEPFVSPTQVLELARQLVPFIRPQEASRAFADLFDTTRATFLIQLPTDAGVPEESDVLAMASSWAERAPEAEEEEAIADTLMDQPPAPGEIVDLIGHAASGVWTAVLDNGVVVHHREMDQRQNFVDVRVTLLGGEAQETAANRGITLAATRAWARPATDGLTGNQVRQIMAGSKMQVAGVSQEDFVQITMTGSPEDLETGMQLAHLLLTEPRLETVPFEQWRTATVQGLRAADRDPMGALQRAVANAVYPESAVAARPLTPEQVEALTMRDAQRWLDALISDAPIEVSIVGDIDRETAFELARTYLGSLDDREKMAGATLAFDRPSPPATDIASTVEIDTQTPAAGVVAGFFASDADNLRDTRLLQLASRTISTRMIKRIREELRLVYSISAAVRPAETWEGFGLMFAGSATDPQNAEQLADEILALFDEFAEGGQTPDEFAQAQAQIAKTLGEALEEPSYWAVQLSQLDKRDRDLDDLVGALDAYAGFTADDVLETFATYHQRPKMRVIVTPATDDDSGEGEASP
jgi:zinc protease